MSMQAAPGELLLFQFLMSKGFSAYNAAMRRGWLALFAVLVLVAQGFAPCAAACRCCQMESPHGCCAPATRMHADCCANGYAFSAFAPTAQKDTVTSPLVAIWMEILPPRVRNRAVRPELVERPPGLHAPPTVLRI